jgi:hypothetical protein
MSRDSFEATIPPRQGPEDRPVSCVDVPTAVDRVREPRKRGHPPCGDGSWPLDSHRSRLSLRRTTGSDAREARTAARYIGARHSGPPRQEPGRRAPRRKGLEEPTEVETRRDVLEHRDLPRAPRVVTEGNHIPISKRDRERKPRSADASVGRHGRDVHVENVVRSLRDERAAGLRHRSGSEKSRRSSQHSPNSRGTEVKTGSGVARDVPAVPAGVRPLAARSSRIVIRSVGG